MPKPVIFGRPSPERIKQLKLEAKLREYTRPRTHKEMMEENRKQERLKRIIEIIRRKYTNKELHSIPRYLPEAEIKTFLERNNVYARKRGILEYNAELEKSPELFEVKPILENIINSFKKTKIRILDLGAGEGNLNVDLGRIFPNDKSNSNRKKVEYHGVDILASKNPKVQVFDFTSKRFPKNTYDVIISMWSLDYVGDKLRTIQNCCDALQVGGKFIILSNIDSVALKTIIENHNPHLEVDINSTQGIIITKNANMPTIFNLRLESVKPVISSDYYLKYSPFKKDGLNYNNSALKSKYEKK
jgi:SAM-dependent methyltransferase